MTTPAKALLHERLKAKIGATEYQNAQNRIHSQHVQRHRNESKRRDCSPTPRSIKGPTGRNHSLMSILDSELSSYRQWNNNKRNYESIMPKQKLEAVRPSPLSMAVIDGLVSYYPASHSQNSAPVPHQLITPHACSEAISFVNKRQKRGRTTSPRSRATATWLRSMSPGVAKEVKSPRNSLTAA